MKFLFGVTVALFRLSKPDSPQHSITRVVVQFSISCVALLSSLVYTTYMLSSSSPSNFSFISYWFATGFLLPLFAVVVCTASSLSDNYMSQRPRMISARLLSLIAHHASTFCLTFYLTAAPFFRLLSSTICTSTDSTNTNTFLCLSPSSLLSPSTVPPLPSPISVAVFKGPRVSPYLFL